MTREVNILSHDQVSSRSRDEVIRWSGNETIGRPSSRDEVDIWSRVQLIPTQDSQSLHDQVAVTCEGPVRACTGRRNLTAVCGMHGLNAELPP